MRTVYHPTIAGISMRVDDATVESWKSSGWRLTAPKNLEPQPTTATPAGGNTAKETD